MLFVPGVIVAGSSPVILTLLRKQLRSSIFTRAIGLVSHLVKKSLFFPLTRRPAFKHESDDTRLCHLLKAVPPMLNMSISALAP